MGYSKKLVNLIIILNIIFVQEIIIAFVITKVEPVVLIGAWFTFTTGELWLLATIKKTKVKSAAKKEENCNG